MVCRHLIPASLSLALLFLTVTVHAQDEIILDPETDDVDFAIQGEYVGEVESNAYGAQVIALGDHQFSIVAYDGGLPGDGWQRGDDSITTSGELVDGVLKFDIASSVVTLADGAMTVIEEEKEIGRLQKVVRDNPTIGAEPPEGAVVLFDGTNADGFDGGGITQECLLSANCVSKQTLGDHHMHIEFRTPFKATARGQGRGNSGVYMQSRYELQILDSFGLEGRDNECGGIYSISEPAVNMCLPPLTWQAFDIDFRTAQYDDAGEKTENARVTIRHNGVVIHDDLELPHGTPGRAAEGPAPMGVYLQGHGNPVVFRNIWVVTE